MDLVPLLKEMVDANASDIFIVAGLPLTFSENKRLTHLNESALKPNETTDVVKAVYELAGRDVDAMLANGNHDEDFSFAIAGVGRFRVNLFRQRGSVAIAMRIVAQNVPDAESLGIPPTVVDLYTRKRGLVLVTGPTGSGKSTTIASIIDLINNHEDRHILTLEDPIEFTYRHNMSIVNQREIGIDSGSYAEALRAALREDPDVLLVGEMRDLETISTAITAAETGHLVFSTLHTIGAASTVDRIIDVFPPHQQQQIRFQLAGVLEAVISQQLLPTADETARVAAFEVLHVNGAVRNMIREGKTHQLITIMQTNRRMGMITMDEAIVQLYQQGRIAKDIALQFAQDADTMQMKLG